MFHPLLYILLYCILSLPLYHFPFCIFSFPYPRVSIHSYDVSFPPPSGSFFSSFSPYISSMLSPVSLFILFSCYEAFLSNALSSYPSLCIRLLFLVIFQNISSTPHPPLALLLHTYWLFRNIPDSLQLILHFFLSLSNHIITSSCIVEDLI